MSQNFEEDSASALDIVMNTDQDQVRRNIIIYSRCTMVLCLIDLLGCLIFILFEEYIAIFLSVFSFIGFYAACKYNKYLVVIYLIYIIVANCARFFLLFFIRSDALYIHIVLMLYELFMSYILIKFYFSLDKLNFGKL